MVPVLWGNTCSLRRTFALEAISILPRCTAATVSVRVLRIGPWFGLRGFLLRLPPGGNCLLPVLTAESVGFSLYTRRSVSFLRAERHSVPGWMQLLAKSEVFPGIMAQTFDCVTAAHFRENSPRNGRAHQCHSRMNGMGSVCIFCKGWSWPHISA